jgi:hypothetical protein
MDPKEKVQAYLRLYERQMSHYESTQGVEWKVTIGLWTLLSVAVYWALTRDITKIPPVSSEEWFRWAVFALPAVHAYWLWRVHQSVRFDKQLWTRYRQEARSILLSPRAVPGDESEWKGNRRDGWTWRGMEAGVTLLLAAALHSLL